MSVGKYKNGRYIKMASIGGSDNIDSALSNTSTNPVQNKVITNALKNKANVDTTYTKAEFNKFTSQGLFPYLFNNITTNFGEFADISVTSELGTLTVSNGNLSSDLYNGSENLQYIDLFFKKPVEVDTNSYTAILFDYSGSISDDVTVQFIRPNNLLTLGYNIDETNGVCSGILGEGGTGANGEIFKGIRINIPSNSSFFTNSTPMIFGIYRSYEGLIGHYSNIFNYTTDFTKTETEWVPTNKQLKSYIDDNQTSITNLQTTVSKNGAKNLLPMTLEGIKSLNTVGTWSGNVYTYDGVTFTVNTDTQGNILSISVNGNSANRINFYLGSITLNGSYIISGSLNGGIGKWLIYLTDHGTILNEMSTNGEGYITDNSGTTKDCYLVIYGNSEPTNLSFYPMIRLATDTDSTFQPYAKTNLELTDDVRDIDYRLEGNACANLLPITLVNLKTYNTTGTWSGNAYTVRNITFTILTDSDNNVIGIKTNGTSNADVDFVLSQGTGLPKVDTTISGCPSGGSTNSYRLNWAYHGTDTGNGASIPYNSTIGQIRIQIKSGTVMNNLIFYPMISRNPNAPYEPYYPSNKELASTRPELKSKTISGTTSAQGIIKVSDSFIIPVFANIGAFQTFDYYSPSVYMKLFNNDSSIYANQPVNGTLYYYEL